MDAPKFPFYTMQADLDAYVKHVTRNKCITVKAGAKASIEVYDYFDINTQDMDYFEQGRSQIIPKTRFDIERQQVILQLSNL